MRPSKECGECKVHSVLEEMGGGQRERERGKEGERGDRATIDGPGVRYRKGQSATRDLLAKC